MRRTNFVGINTCFSVHIIGEAVICTAPVHVWVGIPYTVPHKAIAAKRNNNVARTITANLTQKSNGVSFRVIAPEKEAERVSCFSQTREEKKGRR